MRRCDLALHPTYRGALAVASALGLAAALAAGCGDAPPPQAAATPGPDPAPAPRPAPAADAPRVIAVDPPNGATQVEPGLRTLSVTFDRPMDPEGWAWMRESPESAPRFVGETRFDPSGRVHTTQAELEPGRRYVIWLNSAEVQNFRDLAGVPAEPFRWTFTTRRGAALADFPVTSDEAPRVVRLDPPDGATGVDPATAELRVTFDRPMAVGWSWVQEDPESFPEIVGDPTFDETGRIHTLPVRLAPRTTYVIWLNSRSYQMFQSAAGVALVPRRWTFTTGPAR